MADTEMQALKDKLFATRPNAGQALTDAQWDEATRYCHGYKAFLQAAKTEREAVTAALALATAQGYAEFVPGTVYKPGDKVYVNNRGKALIFAVIGTGSLSAGLRLAAAHIDSPRLDLKQNPLYEDADLALFKTHYYGGIKKYQWAAIPLALHGVVIRADGTRVDVRIGEEPGDPQFCVTDLLPHLADEQYKRPLAQAIKGEELNVLVGARAFRSDEGSDLVKLRILQGLFEKYGIVEADFLSAELELVPAFPVTDIGFDRALIGGYGQDDRVCAYPALTALLDVKGAVLDNAVNVFSSSAYQSLELPKTAPLHTCAVILADKEEIGSEGNTGLCAAYFSHFVQALCGAAGVSANECIAHTRCLSADVNAAFDPTWPSVMEKNNASYLNRGVVVTKYTGSRGKADTSDASAEFTAWVLKLFREADLLWQTGELGKVDEGGGGTVAKHLANLGMDVIDVGVPVLSMHAPFEVTAKTDIWMAHRAFSAFYATQ
ncbi:MAG: aminopeptidase [Oscillospiraceae bacterium]|jgi:aspartyl aminopeptidase|nr:aminopeptidase [Oscillospiraceae bacterium]